MKSLASLSLVKLIGRTPMHTITPVKNGAHILVKLEGNNIGGSIKDRAAWGMLHMAEKEGKLQEQTVIVEPTSGNTGIALAMLGSIMGLKVILTMPESMSEERRSILKAYGAELVLTKAEKGMKGAIEAATDILKSTPGAFMPDQFSNPGNPWAHAVSTAPEIIRDLNGMEPFAFVAGIGTGGTISGVGKALKSTFPSAKVIGVEPAKSAVLSGNAPGPHGIQGIGAGFIPKNLDLDVVDEIITVEDEQAFDMAKWLSKKEGLFCGVSSGANLWAAMKVAEKAPKGAVIVTIAPDRGDKYLSTPAYN
ncbi:cysteine synthase [Thermovirga lienii DSM 17291]|uniref:Cysteine synthase n=1 Tax=Thermovirga lienii (strain ATCC BAA-1197 / DSM 17291 / Cas60314) TaxID=580340 RepID=G7V770_THELD|nr:cysteine synthase A [Thermovirga lienii]AER66104.1 cysteine synthase [Thermovirga lienii DSM 17291]